jgi:preprotein translocase subunit YajC
MTGTAMILAAASKSSSSSATSYLLIIVLVAVMMLFFFRSNRRRQQNTQNTQSQLVKGARVRTVHGMYGTISDIDDKDVTVEVHPGVHIRMLKQAVGTVLPDDAAQGAPDDTPNGAGYTWPEADAAGSAPDEASQQPEGDDASDTPQSRTDLSR